MEHRNPHRTHSPHRNHLITSLPVQSDLRQRARELRREPTPEEDILWQHLRRNQLDGCHFRRQQVIHGYIVDFFCAAADLVIEIDGGIHKEQVEYDQERDQALSSLGLRTLRFTNEDVRQNIPRILEAIRTACRESS